MRLITPEQELIAAILTQSIRDAGNKKNENIRTMAYNWIDKADTDFQEYCSDINCDPFKFRKIVLDKINSEK